MTSIRLEHLSKTFGQTLALADASLQIAAGELFFLLGPSGCGKSTLLRLIAGLQAPSGGRVLFNDRDVTGLTTDKRNAVMVFQSYALWPHLSVRENVRFGLSVRKLPTEEQKQRIEAVLKLTRLAGLEDRKPNELSGGQQQRVALARALAVEPDCLLLDEPLSNLDAKLRHEMRGEIRNICKTQGLTTIYVTHDQKEALSVADRIALMNAGRIVQVGTPADLYHRPASSFVADFIGETNLLRGKVIGREDGQVCVETAAGPIRAAGGRELSGEVTLSIRPEQMRLADARPASDGLNRLEGDVTETTFLGEASEHVLLVKGQKIKVVSSPPLFDPPRRLTVEFDPEDAVVLRE
ncbi:MAG TPA: ABC transporter ATP-binding protein [Tepidisphaeraceae bacterium]|jgi:iron(III) transport system ATP-binding protein|nr:ABC transporter ATP-binding protein [Tepidisphaeraceae bacterium]